MGPIGIGRGRRDDRRVRKERDVADRVRPCAGQRDATDALGCEQLPLPAFVDGEPLPCPTMAPTVGQNTDEVMAEVLGKSEAEILALREGGAFG